MRQHHQIGANVARSSQNRAPRGPRCRSGIAQPGQPAGGSLLALPIQHPRPPAQFYPAAVDPPKSARAPISDPIRSSRGRTRVARKRERFVNERGARLTDPTFTRREARTDPHGRGPGRSRRRLAAVASDRGRCWSAGRGSGTAVWLSPAGALAPNRSAGCRRGPSCAPTCAPGATSKRRRGAGGRKGLAANVRWANSSDRRRHDRRRQGRGQQRTSHGCTQGPGRGERLAGLQRGIGLVRAPPSGAAEPRDTRPTPRVTGTVTALAGDTATVCGAGCRCGNIGCREPEAGVGDWS